eukprot:TRINITY_DN7705_c0_g1_i1.p1 TRINITY_DN7705_c0_g1~~TRINITY_DN7705_c0_g1_i1.p1  ORF type:complete len:783 (-),score=122.34 TRINITY_DN7705_c0_g1_i1:224-2572(-)
MSACEYPQSAAGAIADRIRAGDVNTEARPDEGAVAFLPIGRRGSGGGGGYPATAQVPTAAPAAPTGDDAKGADNGITAVLPFAGRRRVGAGGNGVEPEKSKTCREATFVTDTITTPVARRRHFKPVPIRSCGEGDRSLLLNSSRTATTFSTMTGAGSESPMSTNSRDSASFGGGNFAKNEREASPWTDSYNSFRWSHEVLVQSWHRNLSDSYTAYNMVHVVGEGRSGAVYIVQHKVSEKYCACKVINKADADQDAVRREIELLRRLDHPNIVRLYETNEDSEAVFILMELCSGDLFRRVCDKGHLQQSEARRFARQILSALAYCHNMKVVHRDVKPENVLLESKESDGMVVKLADFGIATRIWRSRVEMSSEAQQKEQVNGSLPYMAPELFTHASTSLSLDQSAAGDIWAVGIVIYVMLSGDLPYGDNPEMICSGEPPDFSAEAWLGVSEDALNLIRRMVNPSVEERLSATQARIHEWFSLSLNDSMMPLGSSWVSVEGEDGGYGIVNSHEVAYELLHCLRTWKSLPKLRRMCIAAIAKRVEADHPSARLAQTSYRAFTRKAEVLTCEALVQALCDTLHLKAELEAKSAGIGEDTGTRSFGSILANYTKESSKKHGHTYSGLHMRQRFKGMVKRISRISEDAPAEGSPLSKTIGLPQFPNTTSDVESVVSTVDGMKRGVVDYTLLVAATLPESVYSDENRIREVFNLFDFKKEGGISPVSLTQAFQTKEADREKFSQLIAPYDTDGDGVLSFEEFRSMVKGEAAVGRLSSESGGGRLSSPVP